MRTIGAIALHDLRHLLQDRSGLLWTFLMPLVFASFFGVTTGGGDPATARAYLTVVNEDAGPLAERLLVALESQSLRLNHVAPDAKATTENKVRTLVIPAGFSTQVTAGKSVALRLEKDPDTSTEAALVAQTRILGAIAHLIAEMAATDAGAPLADDSNDLVRLESRYAGTLTAAPSGFSQSIPGSAVFFVMMVALTYGAATLTQERTSGMLRRLATAPVGHFQIVAGKVAGRLAVAGVQITFFVTVIALARRFFGLDLAGSVASIWLVLMVYALAVAPLGVLYGALFRDPDQAANVGVVTTMILAGLGGCWWPLEITPAGMQTVGGLLPTGWAVNALHQLIAFGRGLDTIVVPLAVLLGFGLVFAVLASRLLRWD